MGDGCISEYKDYQNNQRRNIFITGDKRYEEKYYHYIKNNLLSSFNVGGYIHKSKKTNRISIVIKNKEFSFYLLELGFPQGKKYSNLEIPRTFLNLPWERKKYLVRGLIDTDGVIFAKKNENYQYPYIGFSTKSKKLRKQMYQILRSQRYPVYINGEYNLFMKGIKNVKRWMDDIGASNPKHKFKYNYWLKHGKLPAGIIDRAGGLMVHTKVCIK